MANVLVVDFFNLIKRYTFLIEESPDDGEFYSDITTKAINRVLRVIDQYHIDMLIFCSDSGFNHRANSVLDGTYKANRSRAKSLTEEERENDYLEKLKEILKTLPNIFIEVRDVEADSIVYLVVQHLQKVLPKSTFYIATTDTDFLQLIDENVNIVNWNKGLVTLDNWKEIHNFNSKNLKPTDYALLKSMVGDPSDNIKGIKGLGWKTVLKLLDFLYDKLDKDLHIDNIGSIVSYLNELLEEYNLLSKEKALVRKFLELINNNRDQIDRNFSIISLELLETPYVARVISSLDCAMKEKVSFDIKGFLTKVRFDDQYLSDQDYKKILEKNMKTLYQLKRLAARMERIRKESNVE